MFEENGRKGRGIFLFFFLDYSFTLFKTNSCNNRQIDRKRANVYSSKSHLRWRCRRDCLTSLFDDVIWHRPDL